MTKIENGCLSTEGRGTIEHLVQCRCQVRLAEEEEQTKEMEPRTKAATKYYRKRLAGEAVNGWKKSDMYHKDKVF